LYGLGYNRAAPADVLIRLLDTKRLDFLYRSDLPSEVLDAAVAHPSKRVWGRVAETGTLSAEQWDRLLTATAEAANPQLHALLTEMAAEHATRQSAVFRKGVERPPHPDFRPPATRDEITELAATVPDIEPNSHTYALWWVAALHHDQDAMRQLASSPNLWIRRSVARATQLPPDVVERLAHDEDRVVRLFLAESCDDAPADMLLEVWTWWSGSFSFPGRPRNHPNFPRNGLLRFVSDPEPQLRLLAIDDPQSTRDLVERFSHDPDHRVRKAAAADLRLSPKAAARLVDDANQGVRVTAQQNPALPLELLVGLLLDEGRAGVAASNPAIPATVMQHMIEVACETLKTDP
jgi:hypothetical protein